jgi:hypothetical protein
MRPAGGERGLEEPPGGGEALHVSLSALRVESQEAVSYGELVEWWWRWPSVRL